mmetsp:Transcript_9744/g.39656  ORF Transcript_9744/g.39656 Transcript_9744/m.39656 type:complete len:242 (-) Transcript_9744:137-862(-)
MTSQRHPSKCSSTGALSERPGALRCESRHENSRWASRPSGTRRRASSRRPPCRSRHSRRRRSIKSRGKENVVAHVVKYATTDTTCSLPRGGSRRAAAPRAPARALRAASFVRPRNVRRDARAGLPRRAPPGGVIAEASLGCCCCCCGSGRDAARGRGPALALGRGRVAVRDAGVQVARHRARAAGPRHRRGESRDGRTARGASPDRPLGLRRGLARLRRHAHPLPTRLGLAFRRLLCVTPR